jgi:hypothetical protein
MRVLPPVEEEIRRIIRDERAKAPLIAVSGLGQALEKRFDRGFSRRCIAKVADKVARQSLLEIDRMKIEERLDFTRQNYRMMREELLKIVYWNPETAPVGIPKPLARDRIEAAKNVVMMDLALLSAEIANGMYKKPIEAIVKEYRYDPLPDEVRAVIIASWRRGGLLPEAAVEVSHWRSIAFYRH